MKRFIAGVFAAALIAAPAAYAQQLDLQPAPYTGWYGQVSAGWMQLQDRDGNISGTSVKTEYDDGYALSLSAGYSFGNGFRAELEGGYAHADYDKVRVGGTTFSNTGDISLWSV